ncbi:MAG: response regulator transcription factor [Stygiobacter sp.]|uniref:Response regulator transcription factor n=1 Tax=Stygiobacter electus TaxID=3032292 RepID=A0AAE3TDV8_9BACT|nr:response regulator transcription factor [Stygiobacter electus]MDF1611598.1 response regulator transcription factor [Stygiobacter electus]
MRILVVEDEHKVASFIKKGLEEEFYQVDTAPNGKVAFDLVLDNEYDLIISDVMMPVMDGNQFVKTLRENKILTPVLLLTVKDSIVDKVKGLDSGADDYLTKPFSFEELTARIRALLRRKDSSKENILKVDNLKMDLVSHKVTRDNQEIILTPKEYSILEYLLRNKNKVVSRTKLLEHVYDFHFDTGTNVIDVFINKLRSKIDTPNNKQLLYTVRGAGYLIKDD